MISEAGRFVYSFIMASMSRISSVAAWISPQSCSTSATQLTKSSVLIYSIFRPISENFCPTRPSCSSGKFIHPPFHPFFFQTDFTTIIYHLIHRKFCQKASILDFEPPHVAVFVAVFFMQVSANKKKSYKSVKFWRWFVGFLELLIRFERTTCSLRVSCSTGWATVAHCTYSATDNILPYFSMSVKDGFPTGKRHGIKYWTCPSFPPWSGLEIYIIKKILPHKLPMVVRCSYTAAQEVSLI